MTAPSRRILLYGLLLLLPTIAGGFGVMQLLRREQARIDEQATVAADRERTLLTARARLIVENIELAVDEVRNGLTATLREVPASNPDAFLDEWERTNPLVRSTFRLSRDGRMLRPAGGTRRVELQAWLMGWVRSAAPWTDKGTSFPPQQTESPAALSQRGDVTWNNAQVNSVRNRLQESASQKVAINSRPEPLAKAAAAFDFVGWTPWRENGRLHLIGWRQTNNEVIGVELNLDTITQQLVELLPRTGNSEGLFAVREERGQIRGRRDSYRMEVLYSPRRVAPVPAAVVPLSEMVLPGWAIVGFAPEYSALSGAGGSFLLIGAVLVLVIVIAILAGGSLLLWQARRSAAEAAQKTSFVANVSHEFKTPLTTIRLYAELLEQGRVRDASQGNEYLRTLGRETQRLARLVNNALDFSRLEQGKKKYARERVDLTAEIGRLVETHAPRVVEAGLRLDAQLPTEAVEVDVDRDALEQILLNLIDNACKYAAEGGEVVVAARRGEGGGAEVRVLDRGPGVPVEHRERIFEKFHRVDDALTAEKTGAGLGLSIARQLARGLGGELIYAPRERGGAEFILKLT